MNITGTVEAFAKVRKFKVDSGPERNSNLLLSENHTCQWVFMFFEFSSAFLDCSPDFFAA
jgi:hypothetical protein